MRYLNQSRRYYVFANAALIETVASLIVRPRTGSDMVCGHLFSTDIRTSTGSFRNAHLCRVLNTIFI